jgi:hypothetical protein
VGKQIRNSFSKESISRASQFLQEIHANVSIFFIDDYSRTLICFLKRKSNLFNCLKKFKALVEKRELLFYKITKDI